MKLTLNGITMSFGAHKVLNNVSAVAEQGNIIAVVGQNGAGKTTLFELLSGSLTPTAGDIELHNVAAGRDWQTSAVGRLFQNTMMGCAPNLTVRENLALACLKNKMALPKCALTGTKAACEKINQEFGYDLEPHLDKKMGSLSGGQRQLISFLLLTLNEPAVLLLDEPTAALDPGAATTLLQKTIQWARKKSLIVFIVTHDIELAKTISSHIWLVANAGIEQHRTDMIKEELTNRLQPIQYEALKRI
jgi:putative tryptophan/tyrosine transport system ATP-binding protein